MAKKMKFKPTPAGILFLSAIAVLLIAIIVLIVFGVKNCSKCNGTEDDPTKQGQESIAPEDSTEPTESIEPVTTPAAVDTPDPNDTPNPNDTADPSATASAGPSSIVINTPGTSTGSASPSAGASASASPTIYTKPTTEMKNKAKKGYVLGDNVRMRKGPGTKYDIVIESIAKNTAVTLYTEQDGWWFLQCNGKYGYIRKDLVKEGTAPSTPAPKEATGKVIVKKIALRKSASENSDCLKEYTDGEVVTIYHYEKDSSGKKWYYVKTSDGKKGYMYAEYVKVTSGKVNAK